MKKFSLNIFITLTIFISSVLTLMPMPLTYRRVRHKTQCLSIPKLPQRFKEHIKSCQIEVQANIANELLNENNKPQIIKDYENSYKTVDYQMLRHNHQENLYPTIPHQSFKIVPKFHEFPYKIHQQKLQHNFHLKIPQEVPTKFLDHPNTEQIKFFESPHNADEFSSRDYDRQHEQHEPQIFVTEANYKYSDEITTKDEDKNEIIEARDELMKILAAKAVERREISKSKILGGNLRNNNGTTPSMETKRRNKRSFLTWWTYSAESSGKDEQLEVEEGEKDSREKEEEIFMSGDEKWLAGCLVQCVFKKNGATDRLDYPTLDGIVDLYTSGTIEQPYFMFTLRATNKCLKIVTNRYKLNRKKKPAKGQTCQIAYDVFECVTDAVNAYCNY